MYLLYEGHYVHGLTSRDGLSGPVLLELQPLSKADQSCPFSKRPVRARGTEVLRDTASIGSSAPAALEEGLKELSPPGTMVILRDIRVGHKSSRRKLEMRG